MRVRRAARVDLKINLLQRESHLKLMTSFTVFVVDDGRWLLHSWLQKGLVFRSMINEVPVNAAHASLTRKARLTH